MVTKQKFCSECGAPLEENNHFCPACGAKIIDVDKSDQEKSPTKKVASTTPVENKKSSTDDAQSEKTTTHTHKTTPSTVVLHKEVLDIIWSKWPHRSSSQSMASA